MIDFGPASSSPLAEFDRFFPLHGQNGEFQAQKEFVPRTARRSRAFQAFLATAALPALLSAQRQLHERLRAATSEPDGTEEGGSAEALTVGQAHIDLVTALPADTPPADLKRLYIPMLARATRLRKRQKQTRKCEAPGDAPPAKRQATGIATPRPITDELRRFLEVCCNMEVPEAGVPRTAVVKAVPAYIKKHNLNIGKIIHPDKELQQILGPPSADSGPFTFFNMQKCFSRHFLPPTATQPAGDGI